MRGRPSLSSSGRAICVLAIWLVVSLSLSRGAGAEVAKGSAKKKARATSHATHAGSQRSTADARAKAGKGRVRKLKGKGKGSGKDKGTSKSKSATALTKVPPLPPPRGRVVVFPFRGDDTGAVTVREQVVRALRLKGLKVITNIRPVDSAEQYREMAVTLDLAVYVDGEITDDGQQASATVHIRSGVTGLRVASATFSGDRRKLPSDVGKGLWAEVGPAFSRVCADAATKPRKHDRAPMRIEAGTPIENSPPEGEPG